MSGDVPTCSKCGRTMRVDSTFRLEHEDTDSPGITMQLVQLRADLEEAGVDAMGAEVTVWYCEPCDVAEALFAYPQKR